MAVYRMQATGIELLKPILIWLHDPELDIPTDGRRRGDRCGRELGDPAAAAPADLGRPGPHRCRPDPYAPPHSAPRAARAGAHLPHPVGVGQHLLARGRGDPHLAGHGERLPPVSPGAGCGCCWRRSRTSLRADLQVPAGAATRLPDRARAAAEVGDALAGGRAGGRSSTAAPTCTGWATSRC